MKHVAVVCTCGAAVRADLQRVEAQELRALLNERHQGPGHRLVPDAWGETQSRKMTQKPAKSAMRRVRALEART